MLTTKCFDDSLKIADQLIKDLLKVSACLVRSFPNVLRTFSGFGKFSKDSKIRFFTDGVRNACNLVYFVIHLSYNKKVNYIALKMYRLNGAQTFCRLLCLYQDPFTESKWSSAK